MKSFGLIPRSERLALFDFFISVVVLLFGLLVVFDVELVEFAFSETFIVILSETGVDELADASVTLPLNFTV